MRKYLFIVVLLVWGLAACTSALPTPELTARFQFQYACINLDLDPCVAAEEFAKRVHTRTNGEVKIQISSFSELGLARSDTLRLVEDGTLGLAEIYSRYINEGNKKKLAILNMDTLWGLFQDYDTQMMVTEAIRQDMDKIIETRSGGVVLAYQFYPGNYLFSKKPLRTAKDIKGLKVRTNSAISGDLLEGMGANPLDSRFSDVNEGLESGLLDAAVSCVRCGISLQWYETAHYLVGPITALSHTWITMNKERWAELPADIQVIILEEAKRHEDQTRKMSVDIWAGVEENQRNEMEYIELTHELKDLAAESARASVLARWVTRAEILDSEARRIYNLRVAPIVKTKISADGKAEKMK